MMTGAPTKYLCAILNSRLIQWFLHHYAPTSGLGALRWKKVYLERAPIVQVDLGDPLADLVDDILRATDADANADVSEIETEIDRYVYKLYDLSATEIRAITSLV